MESISNVAAIGGGGSGSDYTAGDGINISQENEIAIKEMASKDMSEIITPLPSYGSDKNISVDYNISEQRVCAWVDRRDVFEITRVMPVLDNNIAATNTKINTLFEMEVTTETQIDFCNMSCETDTSSNQGFVQILLNNTEIAKTYLISKKITEIPNISIPVSQGDIISFKTGWDGSHNKCYWNFKANIDLSDFDPTNIDFIISQIIVNNIGTIEYSGITYPISAEICRYVKLAD